MDASEPSSISMMLTKLSSNVSKAKHECSMSVNPYDTAWVAMVAKPCLYDNSTEWLFPQSYAYLLEKQALDGSWSSAVSDLDSLLCTMAALLALLKHRQFPNITGCPLTEDLTMRISRAVSWLESTVQEIDFEACTDNVGFEILVPSLLNLLREYGVVFKLPHLQKLFKLAEKKMSKLDKLVEALYHGVQATALHSLEAFIGKVDFDRLKGCKKNGGMLGSPSSTVAYLMYASEWDEEAEQFLRDAFEFGQGHGNGGIASAHPIEIFEMSWVASTVLESGMQLTFEDQAALGAIGDHLQLRLFESDGVTGFSRGLLPDADDTAKSIYTLQMLGRDPDIRPIIKNYQTPSVFKTYGDERTPSLTTNCNVLKALLAASNAKEYADSIGIAISFICQSWFSGSVTDKWNAANEYAFMLLAQGLTQFLARKDDFPDIAHVFNYKIPVVLTQLLARLLQTQASDGSWSNGSHEITAYCILALISLNSTDFPIGLNDNIGEAINSGRKFLRISNGKWKPEPIWIEKVRYYSPVLTDVYCTSALLAPVLDTKGTSSTQSSAQKMLHLFTMLPLFSSLPDSRFTLKVALAESQAFLPYLKSTRLDIFPRSKDLKEEKYMEIIPFAWTACNTLRSTPIPADILMEMMSISLLNFQADEYFELIASKTNSRALRWIVDEACGIRNDPEHVGTVPGDVDRGHGGSEVPTPPNDEEDCHGSGIKFAEVSAVLAKYANRVLQHPAIASASRRVQLEVRQKLAGYLQAQITSATERCSSPHDRMYRRSLFNWVRNLGSDDTSCPYSFAFYIALSTWVFKEDTKYGILGEYLLEALCGNLATMCRMFNDYGSLARDREEGNLNCLDFFLDYQDCASTQDHVRMSDKRARDKEMEGTETTKRQKTETGNGTMSMRSKEPKDTEGAQAKKDLMELARFERQSMELALTKLKQTGFKGDMLEALLLFIDVTDLFGQIYVVRDIGTKTK